MPSSTQLQKGSTKLLILEAKQRQPSSPMQSLTISKFCSSRQGIAANFKGNRGEGKEVANFDA
ncbi:hypothetical protein Ahy_B09g095046 isoform C [Arachis hypogaea]|uniref:Uncharacterized protein n=1 Tax=Arachis hypogaea TaxID=3818 RepID=A0A444XCS4_ARAHY|nr:hypothetical protein Ahy_B09g095046 isoform C [Arachis hypogaea]